MAFTKINAAGIGSTELVTLHSLEVLNNATVGGVLTYEDVTNVDSVGLITARNGIVVGSGITLSKDGDGFFTGVTTTGSLVSSGAVSGTTGTFSGDVSIADKIVHTGDTDTAIRFAGDDIFTIETGGSERVRVDSAGLKIPDKLLHFGDIDTAIRFPDADTVSVETGGTERYRVDSSGRLLKSGQAALTSTSLNHPLQVAAASDADAIAIIGRAADDIGELSFYEADKSTNLGEIQYRTNQLNIRHRSEGADINFATTASGGSLTDKVTITSDGKTGINRTPTSHPLEVQHATEPTISLWTDTTKRIAIQYNSSATYFYSYQNSPILFSVASGNSFAERLRITNDGKIGIGGISSPQALTHIYDSTNTSSVTEQFRISGGDRSADQFETGFRFYTQSPSTNGNRHIRFTANGNTGLTIQAHETSTGNAAADKNVAICPSGGRIGMGVAPSHGRVHSAPDGFNPFATTWLSGASFVAAGGYGGGVSLLDGSKGYSLSCYDNGNDFYIKPHASTTAAGAGGVYLNDAGTSWQSASDERDKENLVNITDAMTKVKTLRTVIGNYTWKPENKIPFLIAQDVQSVLPEAVTIRNKDVEGEEERLGMSYQNIIPLVTAALKEAITEIESLKTRLDALEG